MIIIKCEICGAELVNPKHASHIRSKRHQEGLEKQRKKHINTSKYKKDPGNLNILISSIERCGISWFCRFISLIYEKMYGKVQKWNVRTSRLRAGHSDYPIQRGWNTTRYVPIEDIIKKPFDKVILLQRDLESLKEDIFLYRFQDKDYETEKNKIEYAEWINKLENYYKKTYAPFSVKNVLRVHLEDLNNYTIATFNEVLDFLEFPREGRPLLIPVNPPERTWQAFSSVLNKKQKIVERLRNIYYKYNKGELEFIEQGSKSEILTASDIMGREHGLLLEEKKIQKKWQISMNPKVNIPDALEVLRKTEDIVKIEKGMNILIIGEVGKGLGCHFSENAAEEFKKIEMKVLFLPIPYILSRLHINLLTYHIKNKPRKLFSLKRILDYFELDPDLIFIDGTRFCIDNDTDYIVFYNHRGWHLPFVNKNMDVCFLVNENYKEIRERAGISCKMYDFPVSVNLESFYPEKKEISEVVGIGYRRSFDSWRSIVKPYEGYESLIDLTEVENEIFKKCSYKYFDTPIDDLKYRELLRKIKIFWFTIPYGQHVTRRMVEAMACKTLCVFRLDDENHKMYLEKLGFINGVHYVGLKSFEDIQKINEILSGINIDKMIERAYDLVVKNHTHEARAKKVIQIYNEVKQKSDEKIIDDFEEKVDVIVPMYHIRDDLEHFIDNWFKELPIRRLFLGFGKDKRELLWGFGKTKNKIRNKYGNRIVKIVQTDLNTQGKCMAELMKKVKTKWFVYLHQDAFITPYAYEIMKKYMENKFVGCIEGGPIVIRHENGKLVRLYHSRQYSYRGYSGFQVFRTAAVKEIIEKIEDDYVFRNEDIIFQNAVLEANYTYEKAWATYLHYNEVYFERNEKDAYEMILGLIKYTKPNKHLKNIVNNVIHFYYKRFGKNHPKEIVKFIRENNDIWLRFLKPILEYYGEKKE